MKEYFWEPWTYCEGYKMLEDKKYYSDTECFNCPYKGKAKLNIKEIREPVKLNKTGEYVIPYNSIINVCTKSDFFSLDSDKFRIRVWDTIRKRTDSLFIIETKFIDRVVDCVPYDIIQLGNVMIYVSISNRYEEYKIRQLLSLDVAYKGISISPLIQNLNIEKFISTQEIFDVRVNGEYKNNSKCREMNELHLYNIYLQCKKHGINMHTEYYSRKNILYTPDYIKNEIKVNDRLNLSSLSDNEIKEITKKYASRYNVKSKYDYNYILKQLKIKDNILKAESLSKQLNNN